MTIDASALRAFAGEQVEGREPLARDAVLQAVAPVADLGRSGDDLVVHPPVDPHKRFERIRRDLDGPSEWLVLGSLLKDLHVVATVAEDERRTQPPDAATGDHHTQGAPIRVRVARRTALRSRTVIEERNALTRRILRGAAGNHRGSVRRARARRAARREAKKPPHSGGNSSSASAVTQGRNA